MGLGGGFAAGFAQGQSIFKNINQQYQDGEQKRAMAEIADAKPETTSEFTADQGAEMEKLAGQGYKIDFDAAAKSYVAKNEAGDSKVFGMQQYTDLMGQRTAGAMNQSQIDNAKMLKMADVIAKSDPMASLRMKKEVRDGDYQGKRQAREEKAWADEDAISSIDSQLGKSFDQSLVSPDGQKRTATVDDYLAQSQRRIAALNAGGHAKAAGEEFNKNLAWTHSKIQLDTKQREEAFGKAAYAAASGDYAPIQAAYNQFVPDGLRVTGVDTGKDGSITLNRSRADGSAAEPKVFKNRDELLATMNTLNNPMSLYQYAGSEQQRALQLKQDKRADGAERRADEQLQLSKNADARAGSSAARAAARDGQERSHKLRDGELRVKLALEQNPNLSATSQSAIRYGLMNVPGQGDKGEKHTFNPVEIQKSFGEVVSDPLSGKESIKRNAAKEQKFIDWWADNPQFKSQDRALQEFNRSDSKARRGVQKAATPDAIAYTAKLRGISEDEVRAQLKANGMMK